MTIEEKAKAYDEALEKVKPLYERAKKDDSPIWSTYEHLFPHLAESEDERIRKALVWHLKADVDFVSNGVTKAECLAYLEKQKEQPTNEEMLRTLHVEYEKGVADTIAKYEQKEQKPIKCIDFDNEFENQVSHLLASVLSGEHEYNEGFVKYAAQSLFGYAKNEMKPAEWSEEDKKMLNTIIADVSRMLHSCGIGTDEWNIRSKAIRWIKDLPERFALQQKNEWSEEDTDMFGSILATLGACKCNPNISIENRKIHEMEYKWFDELYSRGLPKQEWSKDYQEENIQTRFAFCTYKDDPSVLYLSNVFVEESSRNHGFGTQILKAAEKVAETIEATTISLKVKQDSPANAWYRKNGYDYVTSEDGYDWREKNLEYLTPNEKKWGGVDKDNIDNLIEIINDLSAEGAVDGEEAEHLINFLKSFRPSWKPSEEQIEAVRYFVNRHQPEAQAATGQWKEFTALRGLLGELQKLM